VTPEVNAAIWELRPDFVGLSLTVHRARNEPASAFDARAITRPEWAAGHLAAWRDAYKAFGARPQRTPCSAEALWRRFERDGTIGSVNAVVDLYNAVSLCFAIPVGGEDASAYVGAPRLIRAQGGEPFETVRDGQPASEPVDPGEVIWRDDVGVTCRRWNWRQTPRTRLDVGTTDMWFILERLDPMPMDRLMDAGEMLIAGLKRLAPAAEITRALLSKGSSIRPAP
jgi:DNA/RNA-binding domain of Phe-tRNA-synthetase-like protein